MNHSINEIIDNSEINILKNVNMIKTDCNIECSFLNELKEEYNIDKKSIYQFN